MNYQLSSKNVQKVLSWFNDNQLKVNPDKFSYMVFGRCENIDDFVIGIKSCHQTRKKCENFRTSS